MLGNLHHGWIHLIYTNLRTWCCRLHLPTFQICKITNTLLLLLSTGYPKIKNILTTKPTNSKVSICNLWDFLLYWLKTKKLSNYLQWSTFQYLFYYKLHHFLITSFIWVPGRGLRGMEVRPMTAAIGCNTPNLPCMIVFVRWILWTETSLQLDTLVFFLLPQLLLSFLCKDTKTISSL